MITCKKIHIILLRFVWRHFGPKLGLFLVRSLFLPFGSSFWPMRSRTVPYLLVALLMEVLKWKKRVNTELFPNWPKWHSIGAQQIGLNLSDVTRFVATERVRNKYSLLKSLYQFIVASWVNSLTASISILFTAKVLEKADPS